MYVLGASRELRKNLTTNFGKTVSRDHGGPEYRFKKMSKFQLGRQWKKSELKINNYEKNKSNMRIDNLP
jgi:hypothetical protein